MTNEPVFTARLFKNDTSLIPTLRIYGLLALIMVLLGTIVLTNSKTVQWICWGALPVVLVVIGLNKKLSFNEADDRNIYISRDGIAIGLERYDWAVIDKVGIYVDAFYGFRYSNKSRDVPAVSYGADNWIYFRNGDNKHTYKFLIPNHEMYFLLEDILAAWRADGRGFAWKEVYGRAYVEQQVAKWGT